MSRGRQIGRLKLQPLSPEIKEKFFLDWHAVDLHRDPDAFPRLSSPAVFGNERSLEVEIGAGSGEFFCHLASAAPERNFLGIEVSHRAAQAAVHRVAAAKLDNARILRADFKLLLPLIMPNSWQAAYLHFPDPAHRPNESKRTLFNERFLDAMANALTVGGALSVVSDKFDYFEYMLALAHTDARFARAHAEPYLAFEPEVKSRFQRSWERKGLAPRRFILHKL